PATELARLLGRRELSSVEVVRAHLDRIDRLDGRVHAFTEVFREQALADAAASDARRAGGSARGPLEGVPVSVKECFDVKGRATTLGLPAWRGRIADADSAMVTALRDAGAVVLGRTNLSQTMLYVEARNPLFGQTANPWSLAHSPGGSSGGEGAAVAAGMSPLGVGTDIGGSIRTPAHFCGVVGLKPTLDRLPMKGYRTVLAGQETVRGMGGPLARTAADVALFFRALDPRRLAALDPRVPPAPWEAPESVRIDRLRVGMYVDDGVLTASRSIVRAVERAAQALRTRGARVESFEPPDVRALLAAYLGALSADGGAGLVSALRGGAVDPVLQPLRRMAGIPDRARRALAMAARLGLQRNVALMLESMGRKSVSDLWRLTDQLRSYRARLLEEMDRAGVDVLLCPPFATPAMLHGGSKNFTLASSYSILFNATQMPAGVVPVTRVREEETERARDADLLERQAGRVDARSTGLPVGVQIAGRPWRDNEVVAAMLAVESEVSRDEGFPRTPLRTL
ncbi:MAG TPA: amidase family protein, partial [Polyangiaceae bacterium]|nr:amidase family protein [Polyangiaceae bacterium]